MSAERLLLPYQSDWCATALGADLAIIEKSRRIGITWADAADAVVCAATAGRGGSNVYYISYNLDQAREYVQTCADWAKHYQYVFSDLEEDVIRDEEDDILTFRIRFASGWSIVGLPCRATVLRGKQGRIVIDEAAFIPILPEILKAALAMLMWGGSVRLISTHDGVETAFHELIEEVRSGRRRGVVRKVTIDDALQAGLYRRICEVAGRQWSEQAQREWLADLIATYGDTAQEELYCIPRAGSGAYFSYALVERAMSVDIPVLRYQQADEFAFRPESERRQVTEAWMREHLEPVLAAARETVTAGSGRRSYVGMDIARSGDLTVIQAGLERQNLGMDAVVHAEMRNAPFSEQLRVLDAVCGGMPQFSGAAIDARGNGQMLAEYAAQEHGETCVHQVMLSRAIYAEYFPLYRRALGDLEYSLPKDAGVRDDHRVVQLDRGVPVISESTGSGNEKRHGDAAVAGMLVHYARHNDDGYHPNTYEPVPVTAPDDVERDDDGWEVDP